MRDTIGWARKVVRSEDSRLVKLIISRRTNYGTIYEKDLQTPLIKPLTKAGGAQPDR